MPPWPPGCPPVSRLPAANTFSLPSFLPAVGVEGVQLRRRHIVLCKDYWGEVELAVALLMRRAAEPQVAELSSLRQAAIARGLPALVDQQVPDFAAVQVRSGAGCAQGCMAARFSKARRWLLTSRSASATACRQEDGSALGRASGGVGDGQVRGPRGCARIACWRRRRCCCCCWRGSQAQGGQQEEEQGEEEGEGARGRHFRVRGS